MTPNKLRELCERLERESRTLFPERMRDGHSHHQTARLIDEAAQALTELMEENERLKAEMARRELNENRHCLNVGELYT